MSRTQRFARGAAALVIVAMIAACTKSKEITTYQAIDPTFQRYVALGNSITAGYQSGGINDSTQKMAYPVTFASQVGTRFAIPSLAKPGCPPPIDNFDTQTRVGGGTSTTCALRDGSSVTGIINNLAVPGAAAISPPSFSDSASNALTLFILGGGTQLTRAAQASPTFVSMWIGNNDALPAALSGILIPLRAGGNTSPVISPGLTPINTFITQYKADVAGLTGLSSVKGGVLFAVINVTNAPLLFHSNLLFVPEVKGAFDAAAQTVTTIDASCASNVALVSFQLTAAIASGQQASTVYCSPHPLAAPPSPLALQGDLYILDSVEVGVVDSVITAYNAYIKAKADSIGWAYVDMNPALIALKMSGAIPPFPDLTAPTAAFGAYFTLDGVHPSGLADTLIANMMIDSVNAKYGTSIPNTP